MAPKTLRKIACDLLGTDVVNETVDLPTAVTQYLKDYRLNAADLVSRYPELNSDPGVISQLTITRREK